MVKALARQSATLQIYLLKRYVACMVYVWMDCYFKLFEMLCCLHKIQVAKIEGMAVAG